MRNGDVDDLVNMGVSEVTVKEPSAKTALRDLRISGATRITDIGEVYDVREQIAEGAAAKVYRAGRLRDGEVHALKVFETEHLADAHHFREHQREIDIMQRVQHPSLVKYIECFESKDQVIIAMELLEGQEIFDAIVDSETGFSESEAAELMYDVTLGVQYLHEELGLAHRDIKPENLVYRNKNNTMVKLTDFGLSAFMGQTRDLFKTYCGTPMFMAPEVRQGHMTVKGPTEPVGYGFQCDMWSLGCVLFCLLVGYPPFDEEQISIHETHPSLDFEYEDWEEVSSDATDLIKKLITYDAAQRLTPAEALEHPWMMNAPKRQLAEIARQRLTGFVSDRRRPSARRIKPRRASMPPAYCPTSPSLSPKNNNRRTSMNPHTSCDGLEMDELELDAVLRRRSSEDNDAVR